MKQLILFPGGFKPPHIGHFKLVESMTKLYPDAKLYIIIGSKPRLLVPPFDKKTYQLTETQKREIIADYNTSSKRCKNKNWDMTKLIAENCIPNITAEQSKTFWDAYINLLPKKYRDNIRIVISPMNSPIFMAYSIADKSMKIGDELILIKSLKDHANARFNLFGKLEQRGVKIVDLELPIFRDLSASHLRECIFNRDYKCFEDFMPKKLDAKDVKKLYKVVLQPE